MTIIYETPMDNSQVILAEEVYIIIDNIIYKKEYDDITKNDKFIVYIEDNKILDDLIKYKKLIESSRGN